MGRGPLGCDRNSMGTAVVGGMIFATILGIFLIPVMYCLVVWITARFKKNKAF
ncbi:AcrB/AcrD/AcrF family protein [Selenomonas ruminantium]|uniref:AcrB/AcrD/AcrF family protein n=1 Tax=Selenomonas ruminantium TaxID=971 RepID=A0A1I3EPA1_SELRU|nr:AcrB/AcrD/AcrF family protein [Selenomonas ruminantium]